MAKDDSPADFDLDLTGLLDSEEDEEVPFDLQEGEGRPDTAPILRDLQDLVRRHLKKELDAESLAEALAPARSRFQASARQLETLRTGGSELEQVLARGTAALMHEVVASMDALVRAAHEDDRVSYRASLVRLEEYLGMLEQVYRATKVA